MTETWHSTVQYTQLKPIVQQLAKSVAQRFETKIWTLGRQNNLSMTEWHNTWCQTPQVKTLLSTYIWTGKSFFWGQQSKHLGQRIQMVWKRGEVPNWTGTTFLEQKRWPTTLPITHLQCSTEFHPQTAGWWLWNSEFTSVLNDSVRTLPRRV